MHSGKGSSLPFTCPFARYQAALERGFDVSAPPLSRMQMRVSARAGRLLTARQILPRDVSSPQLRGGKKKKVWNFDLAVGQTV